MSLPKLDTSNYTYSVVKTATCTSDGTGRYTWKTTTYGTFYFDVTIPKGEHGYTYAVTKTPTTGASGTLTGTCSGCGGTTTVTLPKLDTTNYTYQVTKAATCTEDGTGRYTWKTTTYGTFYFDVTIQKTGHSYTYAVTTKPTVSTAGVLTGTCSKCGGTTTVTLPKLDTTNYTYQVTKAATCTEDGTGRYTWKTTTYGSFWFDVAISKTGHSYTYGVTKAPTVSAEGTLTGACSNCSSTTTVALPKLDTTNYSYQVTKLATCTEDGTGRYTWKTTTYGSFWFDVTIPKGEHGYAYQVTKAPTVDASGVLTGTCSGCGGTTTVTLPKLDTANYTYEVTREATCTAEGMGRYTWKTTTYGTFFFEVTIAKTGHSYKAEVTEPTCTEGGFTTHTCTGCGSSFTDSYTDALGHSYGDWSAVKEPACTEEGEETRTCTRCGAAETRKTAALGHDFSVRQHVVSPTCTEDGYTVYECSRCSATENRDQVAATGHSPVTRNEKDATCTEAGYTGDQFCQVCGILIEAGQTVDALGHDFHLTDTREPSGSQEGYRIYTCSRCGEVKRETIPATGRYNPFVDVKEGRFYYDPVLWAVEKGITSGMDATHFVPDGACTRGQVVTFLWRAEGCPEPEGTENPFVDVAPNRFYYKAVLWAAENGITAGMDATHFDPERTVTRGQFVTFLWRAAGKPATGGSNPFEDVSSGRFYYSAVLWAAANGITSGMDATHFQPETSCTRGQVVTFLYRAYGK